MLGTKAMSAWSVKTRCAPSRHCRDARVYGYASTPPRPNMFKRIIWTTGIECTLPATCWRDLIVVTFRSHHTRCVCALLVSEKKQLGNPSKGGCHLACHTYGAMQTTTTQLTRTSKFRRNIFTDCANQQQCCLSYGQTNKRTDRTE